MISENETEQQNLGADQPRPLQDQYEMRSFNRIQAIAHRRQSGQRLNPVWDYFRLYHEENVTRCLIDGCAFRTRSRRKNTQFLLRHLEMHHPVQVLQFEREYKLYHDLRNQPYLPYLEPSELIEIRVGGGPQSQDEMQPFDDEVGPEVLEDMQQAASEVSYEPSDIEFVEEPKEQIIKNPCPVENGLLAESNKFNLMIKAFKSSDGKIGLYFAVSYYSAYDQKKLFTYLDEKIINLDSEDIVTYLKSIIGQVLTRHGLAFEHISHSVLEDFGKIGIPEQLVIFPTNQLPSYRNKLEQICGQINVLTKQHRHLDNPKYEAIELKEWKERNPLSRQKSLVMTELEAIKNTDASGLNRALPFMKDLLQSLEQTNGEIASELVEFIEQTMAYIIDPNNDNFRVQFIKSLVLNPSLVHCLTGVQFRYAKQAVNADISFKTYCNSHSNQNFPGLTSPLQLQQHNANWPEPNFMESQWLTNVLDEANKLDQMELEQRLDYNSQDFWNQRVEEFPNMRNLINEMDAIPASAYISY